MSRQAPERIPTEPAPVDPTPVTIHGNLACLPAEEDPSPALAQRFIDGRPVRHPNGEEIYFSDDSWKIEVRPPARRETSIHFSGVPAWMRRYAKLHVARLWLGQGRSPQNMKQVIGACHRARKALGGFAGPSPANLTPAHAERLHDWLLDRWSRGQEAVADQVERNAGEPIAPRRRRQVLRAVGGLEAASIGQTVLHLNRILQAARKDGLKIDCTFRKPAEVRGKPRRMLGADPLKVLDHDELAAVIDAAQRDIDEYHEVRRELEELCGRADWEAALDREEWEMFARFYGLDGHRPQQLNEIAAALGAHRGTVRGRVRTTSKGLLGEAMGRRIADLQTRALATHTPWRLPPEQREAALAEAREALETVDQAALAALRAGDSKHRVRMLRRWLGVGYDLPASLPQINADATISVGQSSITSRKWGPRVFGAEWKRVRAARAKLDLAYPRAIKACALQVLAVTFRRAAAPLLSLTAEPRMRKVRHRGEMLVGVHVTSFKMWGDDGLGEWVEVPGFHGEVLERAIETVKDLVAPLRPHVDPAFRDVLFLIPEASGSYDRAVPLESKTLHSYVYSNGSEKGGGLFRRRKVPRGDELSIHFFRHTHLTVIGAGGGSPRIAARIAGNSPEMAGTAYMAQGTQDMRLATKNAFERDAATGYLLDAVLRLAMEATGDVDGALPASQLSLDEALRRIRDNPQILPDYLQGERDPTPEMALTLLRNGNLVLNLHSKGGCLLPASEGPCPASDDCPIGCDPEANEKDPTCGCRWLVKVPRDDVIASYEADIATQEAERAHFASQKGYEAWAEGIGRRIAIYRAQLEVLVDLRKKLGREDLDA